MAQKDTNPFAFSDSNKRYYTYDYYTRRLFEKRIAKIPLDIGLTCPNIDGKCARGGCIYCSGGSYLNIRGDNSLLPSIEEQFEAERTLLANKWKNAGYIMYFQAHTNTYAPVSFLREKYNEALNIPGVVGLNIATRADCLSDEVCGLLASYAEKTLLTVELGLQSSNDSTAKTINRGHDFATFVRGYEKLRSASDKIRIGIHLIFGLPGEDEAMMLTSVRDAANLLPDEVKLHLLYVIENTRLAEMYKSGEYKPLERENYVSIICDALTFLPENTVIARLTGDGESESLLAPEYSKRKISIINDIDKRMYSHNLYQGMNFSDKT